MLIGGKSAGFVNDNSHDKSRGSKGMFIHHHPNPTDWRIPEALVIFIVIESSESPVLRGENS